MTMLVELWNWVSRNQFKIVVFVVLFTVVLLLKIAPPKQFY